MSWLTDITERIADATALDARDLELSPDQIRELLDVARLASHESEERINAPLLCFVLGMIHGRGTAFEDAVQAARRAITP
jgi:hypothetical protein